MYRIVRVIYRFTFLASVLVVGYFHLSIFYVFLLGIPYLSLLILGAIFIRMNFYIKSINSVSEFKRFMQIDENNKQICLTFDDGIHAINTPKALDILKQKRIKAHFFIIGKNIKGNEDILKRIHDEGHEIGNHSMYHTWHFDMQNAQQMQSEIEQCNKEIEKITGKKPTIFRPPYGVTNPNLAKAIVNTNMLSMGWNLRSMDTVAKSYDQLITKLISKTKNNSLILLHERCDITVEVLTEYIDYCMTQGFTFVTLNVDHEIQ